VFHNGSRYKDVDEYFPKDREGKRHRSKQIRYIPETKGSFEHVVSQHDRLDLLAHKYYGDVNKWWLICDANPEFSGPYELLVMGKRIIVPPNRIV
jgi:hypothetical protein